MDNGFNHLLVEQEIEIQRKIEEAMQQERTYWQKKAKINWDKFRDLNSKFLQSKVNFRRRNNKIDSLYSSSEGWTSNPNDISLRFVNFFLKELPFN